MGLKCKVNSDGDLLKLRVSTINNVLPGAGEITLEAASILAPVTPVPGDLALMYTPQHRHTQIYKIINPKIKIKVLLHFLYFPPFHLLESQPEQQPRALVL